MMFIAAMAFSACDDDDKNDNIKVPDAVSKALKDKYPAAMDIEWERKGTVSNKVVTSNAGRLISELHSSRPGYFIISILYNHFLDRKH